MLVKSIEVPLVEATAVPLVTPPLTEVPVIVVPFNVAMVVLPSVPSTILLLPELGFLRLVVCNVLIGSLVNNVDRPGVEGVGAVHSGDANAV